MSYTITLPLAFSEIGKKVRQEDALFPHPAEVTAQQPVLVLCDGLGGRAHGEQASQCVANVVGNATIRHIPCTTQQMELHFNQALNAATKALNRLDAASSEADYASPMGTTLTFLAHCTDGMLLAHLGDSRIYQFRPNQGVIFQTYDHSLVNEYLASGKITQAEVSTFPQRNVMTRAVMARRVHPMQPTYNVITDIQPGDVFMMCCDGVTEQLSNTDIERILLNKQPLANRLDALRQCCAERHTRDNYTCWLFEVATG